MSFKNKEKETVSSKVLRQEAGVWGVVLWRKRATTAASEGNVGGDDWKGSQRRREGPDLTGHVNCLGI